jgi:hypothetical protein
MLGKKLYLLDVLPAHGIPGTEARRARPIRPLPPQCRADRGQGLGTQLIQELVADGLHAVTRYQPRQDKVMRSRRCQRQRLSRRAKLRFAESMHAPTAMIENGFVLLPKAASWLAQDLHELTVFPNGRHDDGSTRPPSCSTGPSRRAVAPSLMRGSSNSPGSAPRSCEIRRRGPNRYRESRREWASSAGD